MTDPRSAFAYPLFLDLTGRLVLVVGAGPVGRRKLAGLLAAGARVRLVDPHPVVAEFSPAAVEVRAHRYRQDDLQGVVLALACTGDPAVNRQVREEARRLGVWCGCSDQAAGDFILPAVLRRGRLTLATSTAGASPALAAVVRDQLAEQVSDSWGVGVEIVAAVRRKWLTDPAAVKYNQQVLRGFWRQLLPLLEAGQVEAVDQLLDRTFGADYSLAALQFQGPKGRP